MTDVVGRPERARNDPGQFAMAPARLGAPSSASAIDEEARWRAYQAWLRKTRASPASDGDLRGSVVTPRAPLGPDIEPVERAPESLARAPPWSWTRPLAVSLAFVAGVAIVLTPVLWSRPARPAAAGGGLRIEADGGGPEKFEPRRPLPCFAGGRLVGELSLPQCARRNGVASGPLDVGLDPRR